MGVRTQYYVCLYWTWYYDFCFYTGLSTTVKNGFNRPYNPILDWVLRFLMTPEYTSASIWTHYYDLNTIV